MFDSPVIAPLGDDALLVTFAATMSREVAARVHAVAVRVHELRMAEVSDVVPAYTTLAVYFDSSRIPYAGVVAAIAPILDTTRAGVETIGSLIEIPVRYDGPDIAEVAERTGLPIAGVIERHSSRTYHAYMSGFAPGFAYLGDLDESLVLPRRTVPRVRVAPGSLAIAGAQTAVYPLETPGGWHLIGSTSLLMFDPARDPPALIHAGDTVRFVDLDR